MTGTPRRYRCARCGSFIKFMTVWSGERRAHDAEDPALNLIAEAARPMTGSPLSEAVAHATWHALNAETAGRSSR